MTGRELRGYCSTEHHVGWTLASHKPRIGQVKGKGKHFASLVKGNTTRPCSACELMQAMCHGRLVPATTKDVNLGQRVASPESADDRGGSMACFTKHIFLVVNNLCDVVVVL